MDIIEQLIKSLQEAKAELQKDAANPKLAPKEVKVKQLQAQVDAGTYKPDPKKIASAMIKEELTCSENGQWDVKKWNMEKRCWEGYEPTPGKKAYSDDSCKPIKKEEEPHADDPQHEEKEKVKAEKIKQEAQELLDMHNK